MKGRSDCDLLGEKISVCLLTYNHVNVIESTLQSILDQTITGYEVIVSDDCSSDGTWERILQMAAKDARIRPIQTPNNMGMPGNANYAVAQSSRHFVALLHHDDLYRCDLLEKWASVMERFRDTVFVFNPYDVVNAERHYGKSFDSERIDGRYFLEKHLLNRWGCAVRGTAMIRRSAWDEIGGMREQFNLLADVDMWMRLSHIGAVGYVPEPVIKPRHIRPEYYPDIYIGKQWHWERQILLYEIHAVNNKEHFGNKTLFGLWKWCKFRTRLSIQTAIWLAYAVVRRKWGMIESCQDSVTKYDQVWLRGLRYVLFCVTRPYFSRVSRKG